MEVLQRKLFWKNLNLKEPIEQFDHYKATYPYFPNYGTNLYQIIIEHPIEKKKIILCA